MSWVKEALGSLSSFRLMQIFAALALALSVWVGVEQMRLTNCLTDYNEASNRATAARWAAAEQDRAAQDRLFRAVADNPRSAVVAIREYTQVRAQADEQRRKNPLPAPPSQSC